LPLKYRHNSCSVSVVRFLRPLAKGISLFAMNWFTLSLTLSRQGRGDLPATQFPKEIQ
jgi:hypothetical protein